MSVWASNYVRAHESQKFYHGATLAGHFRFRLRSTYFGLQPCVAMDMHNNSLSMDINLSWIIMKVDNVSLTGKSCCITSSLLTDLSEQLKNELVNSTVELHTLSINECQWSHLLVKYIFQKITLNSKLIL